MPQPSLNFPIARKPQTRIHRGYLALMAGIVALVALAVVFKTVRDELTEVNYVDTDAEWLNLIDASKEGDEPITLHPSLCKELERVADGKDSSLSDRLPSSSVARRAFDEFCPKGSPE